MISTRLEGQMLMPMGLLPTFPRRGPAASCMCILGSHIGMLDGTPSRRHNAGVARKKTTIYLEPDLLTATKTLAASSGRREYEVIEDALRAYMRSDEAAAGRRELRAMLDRWSEQDTGLGEDEALELATREVHAYRRERSGK